MSELHIAAGKGDLQRVKELIEKGAEINARDDIGRTPLHYAAASGHLEVIRLLVEEGANVNARNIIGFTPLHYAAEKGYLEIVRLLLEAGADPTLRDNKGFTPAELARIRGHTSVVQLLEDWSKGIHAGLIVSVEVGGLVEGEWGVLRVRLNRPSRLVVEGDVEWLDPGEARGVVKVPVKPRKPGKIPITIVAKSGRREERKIIWIEVAESRRMKGATLCPNCWAPQEPDAKYCWRCGARLD